VISIAMATYNGEKYLERQLRSLAEQALLPDELVICDDASTDTTLDIVKRFSEKAPFRVRLFNNEERLGWRRNFLKAASLCRSEYIGFCDQDDIWLSNKLATAASYLEKRQCMLFQHGFRLIDDNDNVISGDINHREVVRDAPWRHSYGLTQIFHRSLLEFFDLWELSEDHFIANNKMAHDQWVSFLSSLFDGTVTIDDVLLHYRQHNQNTIGPKPDNTPINVAAALEVNLSRLRGGGGVKQKRDRIVWNLKALASAARAREKITETIISRFGERSGQALPPKQQYYREYREYLSIRQSAYLSDGRTERLRAVLSVLRRGLYRKLGRGVRDVTVDLTYGVLG
jgi:glycosyltransferase involved in cell wall biosynthesis